MNLSNAKGGVESAYDSAKLYTNLMTTEQRTLFDGRKYNGVAPQAYQIVPLAADQSILKTLPAYHAYLSSGDYSKYTPDDFTSDIKKLGLFLSDKAVKDVQTVDIQRRVGELKKSLSAKTVSRKVSAIGNYFAWLEEEKVVTHNPAKDIRAPRVTSPLPDILFDSECQRLLDSSSQDPRTYLLLLLLLETGLKKAELLDLKVTHFDFSNKYQPELWVKHIGKQVRKDRKLRMPPEIIPAYTDYVEGYRVTDSLFPYTPRFVELLLTGAAKQAKIQKKVTAGILRDTFVVRSLKRGMKLEDVLHKIGLSESSWEDARKKYTRLTSEGI
jgi:site-specific recombinase XerD